MGQFLTGITWAIATNTYVNLYDIGGLTRKAAKMGSKIFEEMYKGVPPWEIEGPQSEIVHLAEHGEIRSPVLDAGCGTGENTLYLAGLGFEVVGIDIVPAAVEKALNKAKEGSSAATFMVWDALRLDDLHRRFNTVIDSGFFHVLPDKERPVFVKSLASVLDVGGSYLMMCFSEHEPGAWGPRRVTQAEIRESFRHGWFIDYIREARFDTNLGSRKCNAWLCSITLVDSHVMNGT
ncbi:MAG: class I SAM-dependent methyltransferase [Syntrophobacteraceae bacterium]